ncbi:hypothetical protein EV179_004468 [Coemansia sp. RSA 487]|nr:hypothetical protein IW138_004723 [Coemansia sp. RSA 986]KAJ2212719.1 hypothetical protein EV179_004468 [Coemansia sp. RSA 487]
MAQALAEVGPQKVLEIKPDLRAAIGALKALQCRDPKRPWCSSPMAALLAWGSIWFEEYSDSLGAPRTAPFWACWNDQPAPGKPGSLIKRIGRTVVDEQLLGQVRVANPQEQIEQEDVKDMMAASIWFSTGKGKFHAKNSFRKTTERDTSERSLVYKLLLGNILAMKREAAWYLQAHPELEMRHCPRGYTDEAREETRSCQHCRLEAQ